VDEHELLAARFEENRSHLRSVAYRILGSVNAADDAVQEAWLRLSRSSPNEIDNLGGWLTTVVSRVCLDMLRARKARPEDPLGLHLPEPGAGHEAASPEEEVLLADSVGVGLLLVLETLAPAERVAFVLHDLFAVPFEEIAGILGRSPVAVRQLASRARRRVQGAQTEAGGDRARHRELVAAFLAASRGGDFEALLALLDPDVVVRADGAAVAAGASAEVHGATAVAQTFSGRAQAAQTALVDGVPGLVWAPGGQPRVVLSFSFDGEKVVAIDLIAEPERLRQMSLVLQRDAAQRGSNER
jgi:RNA polymerase sigma factor (sigma-70 family)